MQCCASSAFRTPVVGREFSRLGRGICQPASLSAPARLPGRETRLDERPIDSMDHLISALADAIAPYLDKPFALLGHSMGAAIAFELARALAATE